MPVHWTVDHTKRMIVATVEGVLRLSDLEDYLEELARAATLSYRKIFDMSQCSPALSKEDMLVLGVRIRAYPDVSVMGPVAIVAGSDYTYQQARLFESLAVPERPLRIFRELQAAREWLDTVPATAFKRPVQEEWLTIVERSPDV